MERLVQTHFAIGRLGFRMFLLNLYWIIFTLLGGILLGIIPATKTVYQILQEEQSSCFKDNQRLLKRFWQYYKTSFISVNKLFLPVTIMLALLIVDLRLLEIFSFSAFDAGIYIILQILVVMTINLAQNLFVISLNLQRPKEIYRTSLILMFGKPIFSITQLILIGIVCALFYLFPGIMMVFGISLLIYIELKQFSKVL